MEEFKRENRYVVLKRKDVHGTLTLEELGQLNSICVRVEEQRRLLAKPKLRCVVVESDWKIYDEVWALVQQEAEGASPQLSLYDRLANQVADLKRELSEAKEREARLRKLLFLRVVGASGYSDDGELQDSTTFPVIDFKHDSVQSIEDKLIERGVTNFMKTFGAALQEQNNG